MNIQINLSPDAAAWLDAQVRDGRFDTVDAANPVILGRQRPELLPDLRSVPSGNFLIFIRYTPADSACDTVEVVNILNGRRDIEARFKSNA